VHSTKIRVTPAEARRIVPLFPEMLGGLRDIGPLIDALTRLHRFFTAQTAENSLVIATLAEVLSLWPRKRPIAAKPGEDLHKGVDEQIEHAAAIIEANLSAPPSVEQLAKDMGLSRRQLVRRFRSVFGIAPHRFITRRRVIRARELLANKAYTITEASAALGFTSIYAFSGWFRRVSGVSPSQCRAEPDLL
jgi:AraC-like DNA-binding protein